MKMKTPDLTLPGTVMFSGGGGDQHPSSGFVSQRETRHRAEEETWPQSAHRTQAEPHQELARRTDLQRVCIHQKLKIYTIHQGLASQVCL